jgi:hypothetical protein
MLRRVALVRTDVSEELSTSFIRMIRIGELRSSETSFLTRAARRNISGDAVLHIHRRENLKSYIQLMSSHWQWHGEKECKYKF